MDYGRTKIAHQHALNRVSVFKMLKLDTMQMGGIKSNVIILATTTLLLPIVRRMCVKCLGPQSHSFHDLHACMLWIPAVLTSLWSPRHQQYVPLILTRTKECLLRCGHARTLLNPVSQCTRPTAHCIHVNYLLQS